MKDDPVGLSRSRSDFLRLRLRQIENLDATRGDLDLVVMVVLVPGFHRHMRACDRFGDKVLPLCGSLGVDQAKRLKGLNQENAQLKRLAGGSLARQKQLEGGGGEGRKGTYASGKHLCRCRRHHR
jgi:hypothetical protein